MAVPLKPDAADGAPCGGGRRGAVLAERVGRVRAMGHGERAVALPSSADVPRAVFLLLLALALLLLLPPPLTLSVVNSRTVSVRSP
jgi:hypothetical protein